MDAIRGRTTYLVGELLQTLHMNMRAFPDAGHGLNHELADTVNEAVLELLR